MTINLPPEFEKFVQDKLRDGQYSTADQVVIEALEVLREQEAFAPDHEAYLREEIQKGIEQVERGEYAAFDAESIIREKHKERAEAERGR